MGYFLQAIIAPSDAFDSIEVEGSAPVELAQGLSLLPVTTQLRRALGVDEYALDKGSLLPPPVRDLCAAVSLRSRAVYVEAGMAGGPPLYQGFVAFDNGEQVADAVIQTDFGPLSEALRFLGAQQGSHYDEFDAVDLGRHRETDDWIER